MGRSQTALRSGGKLQILGFRHTLVPVWRGGRAPQAAGATEVGGVCHLLSSHPDILTALSAGAGVAFPTWFGVTSPSAWQCRAPVSLAGSKLWGFLA